MANDDARSPGDHRRGRSDPDQAAPADNRCRRLFIGGVSWDTTDEKFRAYFEQFGALEEAIIMRDKATGQSRGFGFVTFMSPDPVPTVLAQSLELDGRQIDPKVAVRKEEMDRRNANLLPRDAPDRKIFVGSVPPEVTADAFRTYFEAFGPTQEAVLMKQGYGFVRFLEQSSVEAVLNQAEHVINGMKVEPQRATPRRADRGPAPAPPPPRSDHYRGSSRAPDDYGYGPARRGRAPDPYYESRYRDYPAAYDQRYAYSARDDRHAYYDASAWAGADRYDRYGYEPAAAAAGSGRDYGGRSAATRSPAVADDYGVVGGRQQPASGYPASSSSSSAYYGYATADTATTGYAAAADYGYGAAAAARSYDYGRGGDRYAGADRYEAYYGRDPYPSSSRAAGTAPARSSRYDAYPRD
ncbi:unnamed protein product (mitochondrion) [Plasmodiophora brassicae]|uniref:RRM domain-containing protein n=1 Tax=Plasmodiophora brassicae TaxID=37360 RepID=A0A3P3YP23_PLABS|nr:unnamed protein product [Plasmodiophora brassicae]